MNCLKFADEKSYLDEVNSLSDEKIIEERRNITNLAERIKFDYNMFRSTIYTRFFLKAKKLLNLNDEEVVKKEYKKLLKALLNYAKKKYDSINEYSYFYDSFKNIYDYIETRSRDETIALIKYNYELIQNGSESGYLDLIKFLSNYVINFSGASLYKLYGLKLMNDEFLSFVSKMPKLAFGGPDENGNIDYKFAIKRFIDNIASDIELIEENIKP